MQGGAEIAAHVLFRPSIAQHLARKGSIGGDKALGPVLIDEFEFSAQGGNQLGAVFKAEISSGKGRAGCPVTAHARKIPFEFLHHLGCQKTVRGDLAAENVDQRWFSFVTLALENIVARGFGRR